jgi:DNA-binding MarR family transcriptional regulator
MIMPASIPDPGAAARHSTSRAREAATALSRAQARIDDRLRRILDPAGLSPQQFQVLRILRAHHDTGLPTLAIAERMTDRSPGITRLLDRLERRGLVQRVRGEDRRQVLCSITPRGDELLASLEDRTAASEEAAFARLTRHEVGALIHLLDRVSVGAEIHD